MSASLDTFVGGHESEANHELPICLYKILESCKCYVWGCWDCGVAGIAAGMLGVCNELVTISVLSRAICALQVSRRCKAHVMEHGKLWDQPRPALVSNLDACIRHVPYQT